jgi:predicted porin
MNAMKKSLLALAVLSAFAGAAAAQSSLTIFGVLDANVGKDIGSDDKRLGQGAQSRLGFRGVEDIGNGLKAFFHIQTRLDSGTGANAGTDGSSPFWQAEANVGMSGGFGNVRLGRNYTEAFYHTITVDPWGYDTVANLKPFATGGIAADRVNNAISYWITNSGITFGVNVAENADNGLNTAGSASVAKPGTTADKRPASARLMYAAGPLAVGISFENPGEEDDDWTLVNGSYDFGVAKVGAFYGTGTNVAGRDRKSFAITAVAPFGQGQARAAFGKLEGPSATNGPDITQRQQISLGYFYSLSKRTIIYGDVATAKTDNAALVSGASGNGKDSDSGYDFGIKHTF